MQSRITVIIIIIIIIGIHPKMYICRVHSRPTNPKPHMQARPGYICITLIVKRSATKFPYLPAGTDAERCL